MNLPTFLLRCQQSKASTRACTKSVKETTFIKNIITYKRLQLSRHATSESSQEKLDFLNNSVKPAGSVNLGSRKIIQRTTI
jgi:hypothetical protein